MASVGVRELQRHAGVLVRRVAAGETIEITRRGRPVARLVPIPEAGQLDRLRASGAVIRATRRFEDLPPPLPLAPGQEPPSEVLRRLREHER